MKSSYIVPFAILLGGAIVAGAVYLSIRGPSIQQAATNHPELVRQVTASDHLLGNPAASIVIVEYSDFDCEFCKDFNETMHQIIANEGVKGKVAWVYREFPLFEKYPNALQHARAAECAAVAAGNDAFWKFSSVLFEHQPANPAQYGIYATKAGISDNLFASCLSDKSSAIDARITADRQNALNMGASGTPFSILIAKGRAPIVMEGAYSYSAIKKLIDDALASQ